MAEPMFISTPMFVATSDGIATATPVPGQRATSHTSPPVRGGSLNAWLTLLGLLMVAAVPLLIGLSDPDVMTVREAEDIARSVETWRHLVATPMEGLDLNPLVPRVDGQPQPRAAPGITWLHLLALTLDPDLPAPADASIGEIIFDARLVSVGLAMLTLASVFWASYSIGNLKTGLFGAMVCLGNPLFLYNARQGTSDMAQLGFVLFAVASALWAIRPLRPSALVVRQAVGWMLCGVSLGMAVLCAGPIALAWTIAPIGLILMLCPHRLSHVMGAVAALLLAGLMLAPWAAHVHEMDPGAWSGFFDQYLPGSADGPWLYGQRAGRLALWLMVAAMPWTLWLIAGLLQPFSTSSTGARTRMFIGWGWLVSVSILIMFTPGTRRGVSEVLILLPVAAVLVGQLFRQLSDLSSEGRHVRLWRAMRWPQLGLFFAVSLALPGGLLFQDSLARQGFLPRVMVAPMHWTYWVGAMVVLLLLTGWSLRLAMGHHPGRTLAVWAGWVVAAFVVVIVPLSRGPLFDSVVKTDAALLNRMADDGPVYVLSQTTLVSALPQRLAVVDPLLRLYADQTLREITLAQLRQLEPQASVFVLAPMDQPVLPQFVPVQTLPHLGLCLWHTRVPIVEYDTPAP